MTGRLSCLLCTLISADKQVSVQSACLNPLRANATSALIMTQENNICGVSYVQLHLHLDI